ncbi:unnamed protein product, partial [Ectocarpus fasciculatus]
LYSLAFAAAPTPTPSTPTLIRTSISPPAASKPSVTLLPRLPPLRPRTPPPETAPSHASNISLAWCLPQPVTFPWSMHTSVECVAVVVDGRRSPFSAGGLRSRTRVVLSAKISALAVAPRQDSNSCA